MCNQYLSPLKLWVWIPLRWGVLDTTLCDKVCQWLATGRCFSPGTPVSSTNKTDRHDIAEILLKVELNIITLTFICFVDISDESSRYPPIPTCHITAIQGDSILLTWDVSNDIYKVLYVVQMKTVEDTKWKIFKGEVWYQLDVENIGFVIIVINTMIHSGTCLKPNSK